MIKNKTKLSTKAFAQILFVSPYSCENFQKKKKNKLPFVRFLFLVSHQLENFSHFNQGWSISPITKNCSCIHWVGILCCSQTSPPHCQRYPVFIKLPFSFHYTNWSERMLSNWCYCFKIKSCPQMFVSPLKKMRKVILWDFVDFCEWDFQKKLFANFNILNLGRFKKLWKIGQPTNQPMARIPNF